MSTGQPAVVLFVDFILARLSSLRSMLSDAGATTSIRRIVFRRPVGEPRSLDNPTPEQ